MLVMRELLRREPLVAAIALSGQKHILFRCRPGWWQVEEDALRPNVEAVEAGLDIAVRLLDLGFSKAEVASGRYSHGRIWRTGEIELWRRLEQLAQSRRGSAYFALAV